MGTTLAPNTTSEIREDHVPENTPSVLSHHKSQDRDVCGVCEQDAFATLARNDSSIRVVGALKAAILCAASTTTSISATSTGSLQICYH